MARKAPFLTFFLALFYQVLSMTCPCQDSPAAEEVYFQGRNLTGVLSLCMTIDNSDLTKRMQHSLHNVNIKVISPSATDSVILSQCSVVFQFSEEEYHPHDTALCPGVCRPVPMIRIPLSWTEHGVPLNATVTCSQTASMLLHLYPHRAKVGSLLFHHVAPTMFWRRLMECYEHKLWQNIHSSSHHAWIHSFASEMATGDHKKKTKARVRKGRRHHMPHRRSVAALVIWIGSQGNIDLIKAQASVMDQWHIPDSLATQPSAPDRPGLVDSGWSDIVGWAATDETYPCRPSAIKCLGRGNKQYKYLPNSAINFMPPGWGCAQRRPLRALAHALLLFSPQFVILADDDTFINFPLLMQKYQSLLFGPMLKAPIYMGEFVGSTGPTGHLTTQGLFAGGSGYILGRELLDRLVAYEVRDFSSETSASAAPLLRGSSLQPTSLDEYRSASHKQFLGLVEEGVAACGDCPKTIDVTMHHSGNIDSSESDASDVFDSLHVGKAALASRTAVDTSRDSLCMQPSQRFNRSTLAYIDNSNGMFRTDRLLPPQGPYQSVTEHFVPISVRLIDFCTNLMANENTCQHSDHSLGRCLVYGAFASPIGAVCQATTTPTVVSSLEEVPAHINLGFCFMTPHCDVTKHVTCHRYRPGTVSTPGVVPTPVRTQASKGYYSKYSSSFNGQITDSNM